MAVKKPGLLEKLIIQKCLEESFTVIIPYESGMIPLYFNTEIKENAQLIFYPCSYSEAEEVQQFQTYLFENWDHLKFVFTNLDEESKVDGLVDASEENLQNQLDKSLLPFYHLMRCVFPLMDPDYSRIFTITLCEQNLPQGAGLFRKVNNAGKHAILESLQLENPNSKIKLVNMLIHLTNGTKGSDAARFMKEVSYQELVDYIFQTTEYEEELESEIQVLLCS